MPTIDINNSEIDVDFYIISGPTNPTTSTVGNIGQFYKNTTNGSIWKCTSIEITDDGNAYIWHKSLSSLSYIFK